MELNKYRILRAGADLAERTADSKTIFRGRILNLRIDEVILPDGSRSTREVVEHSGAVVIIPVLNNGNILFVRQYRYPIADFMLELPAGKLDHAGEEILECAKRELTEETGYTCASMEKLLEFYTSPGFCDEKLHLLIARELEIGVSSGTECDVDEFIAIADFTPAEALEMIAIGKITDAKTILGILYYNNLYLSAGKNMTVINHENTDSIDENVKKIGECFKKI